MNCADPIYSQWKDSIFSADPKTYEKEASWYKTAQQTTLIGVGLLIVGVLASPYLVPITYWSLLSTSFAVLPIVSSIPIYFYNFCAEQALKTTKIAEKILFLRENYENIPSLESSIEYTFGSFLSEEKKLLLERSKIFTTPILTHLAFTKKEIAALEEEKQKLYSSLTTYVEKDLDGLLEDPLFAKWQGLIQEIQQMYLLSEKTLSAQKLLQGVILNIKERNPSKEALEKLQSLSWDWYNKESLSPEEKWTSIFSIEEKILSAKLSELFLWTFLFLPDKYLESYLQKNSFQIENSLNTLGKKISTSLADLSIGQKYKDPAVESFFTIGKDCISRNDLLDPAKKEQILDKLIQAIQEIPA